MIILSNGKNYFPLAPLSYREMIQGQERAVFEFHFKADDEGLEGYTLDEIRSLYKDTSPFSDIIFYEDIPDSDGKYKFLSEYQNFTVPVEFHEKTIDGTARYIVKVAQMSTFELEQKAQAAIIAEQQEALIELASLIG